MMYALKGANQIKKDIVRSIAKLLASEGGLQWQRLGQNRLLLWALLRVCPGVAADPD